MTSTPSAQPLSLRGAPRSLRLFGPLPPGLSDCRIVLPGSLSNGGQTTSVRAQVLRRPQGVRDVRASLPPHTPPGEYEAQLEMNGESHPIALSIEPSIRLHATPVRAVLEAEPGNAAEQKVTLVNQGNVAIKIAATIAIDLHDERGLEEAFASTWRQGSNDPQDLLRHFIMSLRAGDGGLLKLRIDGAAELPPGAEQTLTLTANLPEKLKPGHSYYGEAPLGPLRYPIDVKVVRRKRGG